MKARPISPVLLVGVLLASVPAAIVAQQSVTDSWFDALLVQGALVGTLPPGTVVYPRGDADCNMAIQSADAVYILRAAVGLPAPGVCVNTVK